MKTMFVKLSLLLLILSAPLSALADPAELKVGAVLAQTGPASIWGKYARMGAELAVADINAHTVHGDLPPVKLLIEDGRTSPAAGVTAFQKLVTQDKVHAVLGDVWAFITQPMIPLANRSNILLISPTVVPESISDPGRWFYSMGAESELSAPAISEFFEIHSKFKRVAIFAWDDPWGDSVRKIWKREIEKHGMTVVREVSVRDFDYDYRTDVARVVAEKPEIILISYQADRIVKALQERKFSVAILSTEMIEENLLNESLPWVSAQGIYAWSRRPTTEFQERFRAKYGEEANYLAQNSYDAIHAIARAHVLSQTGDLSGALRRVQFEGVSGPIDFRQTSWGNRTPALLYRITGRDMVPVDK